MIVNSKNGVYIGDPCYAMSDKYYHDNWGEKNNYKDGEYSFDGYDFIVAGTAYGDGDYLSNDGKEFPVDAGCLSIIDLALCDAEKLKSASEVGLIIEHPGIYSMDIDDGLFDFSLANGKSFYVNTKNEDEEEDDDWYEEDEDDYESLDESKKRVKESIQAYAGNAMAMKLAIERYFDECDLNVEIEDYTFGNSWNVAWTFKCSGEDFKYIDDEMLKSYISENHNFRDVELDVFSYRGTIEVKVADSEEDEDDIYDEYGESANIKLNGLPKVEETKKKDNRLSIKESKDVSWLSNYYSVSEIENNKAESKEIIKEALDKIINVWSFTISDKQKENATNIIYNLLMEENIKNSAWGEE